MLFTDRHTNKRTDTGDHITSLAEVMNGRRTVCAFTAASYTFIDVRGATPVLNTLNGALCIRRIECKIVRKNQCKLIVHNRQQPVLFSYVVS